jgi:DNA-binding transcriptional regulator PaaX
LITQVGRKRLEFIKSKDFTVDPFVSLDKLKKGELKVIDFDIPELERRKRDWLRVSLMNLGFEMLQKSVWVGNTDLPEEFILSLNNLEILSHLHMFIVKEMGTIGLKSFKV